MQLYFFVFRIYRLKNTFSSSTSSLKIKLLITLEFVLFGHGLLYSSVWTTEINQLSITDSNQKLITIANYKIQIRIYFYYLLLVSTNFHWFLLTSTNFY